MKETPVGSLGWEDPLEKGTTTHSSILELLWWLGRQKIACKVGDLGSILGREDPLKEGMATHSSTLSWRIPWTEEPGGLQTMGSQRVRYDGITNSFSFLFHIFA